MRRDQGRTRGRGESDEGEDVGGNQSLYDIGLSSSPIHVVLREEWLRGEYSGSTISI